MEGFRTKRGRCVFDEQVGELRLHGSWRGYLRNVYAGSTWRFLAMLLLPVFTLVNLYAASRSGLAREFVLGVALVVGIAAVYSVVRFARGFGDDESIPLGAIHFVEGDGRRTHPQFVVYYGEDGEETTCRVTLPSKRLSYTMDEFEEAWRTFERYGVPVELAD